MISAGCSISPMYRRFAAGSDFCARHMTPGSSR